MYRAQENIDGWQKWKTFEVKVTIKAPNPEKARKLIEYGFDLTMSFEDKNIHKPEVFGAKEVGVEQ